MQPLAGLRILDLTRLLPGPAATMHLADYGAEVIKIEDTAEGDYLRAFPPLVEDEDGRPINPAYGALNRGKRSIRIDLKQAAGRDLLLRLVDRADALIEGFRPGVLVRLELGWEVLHARNPRLVLCSISGYGQDGPMSQVAGHDINYCAMAGVLEQTRAGGVPALPSLQIGDTLGGTLSALSALLIALLSAQRTGVGRHVDVAMTDGVLAHHIFAHAMLDASMTPVAEQTLLTGGVACYRIYECADARFVALGALEPKFWQAFCTTTGLPELAKRHWAFGEAPGSAAAQKTTERVAAHLRTRARDEWIALFDGADACLTPVLAPAEALAHPLFTERGRIHRRGGVTAVGPLAIMSEHHFAQAPAPRAGADTEALLRELGLSDDDIARLRADGVVREQD
ncbi:MAG TPA: CaiB/BaiF CoA-transferase family protein [Burkholderiaceae bacterium]|nr:CaiB/BaiF CoA-transferase family protein [Burkholderiaceae bacterium]